MHGKRGRPDHGAAVRRLLAGLLLALMPSLALGQAATIANGACRLDGVDCGSLPAQTGAIGKSLASDGTAAAWAYENNLPATFNNPVAVWMDTSSNVFVIDNSRRIRRIDAVSGAVTTFAGSTSGSVDGTGVAAKFSAPTGITGDSAGNLYTTDSGSGRVRKVTPAGVVTTLVGSGTFQFTGELTSVVNGIGTDPAGNLYVADLGNHRICKVTSEGVVTTIAGSSGVSGSTDGTGSDARFFEPAGLVVDSTGTNIYVVDFRNHTIRKVVIATGEVTTVAGAAGIPAWHDATGIAARFNYPHGIGMDASNLYVTEAPHTVRQIVISTGAVTTVAGVPSLLGTADGSGGLSRLNNPQGIFVRGTIVIADFANHTIRRYSGGGLTTLAGVAGAAGTANGPRLASANEVPPATRLSSSSSPWTLAFTYTQPSPGQVLSVTDLVTAGWTTPPYGLVGVAPYGITQASPDYYITDRYGGKVYKVSGVTGVVTFLAGSGSGSSVDGGPTGASFVEPRGITSDGQNLYIADYGGHTIRKVSIATGTVSTIAGSGTASSVDGTGTAATFKGPEGILYYNANLYVTEPLSHTVRKIVLSTRVVTTLAGTAGAPGSTDDTGALARFNGPKGITTDNGGNIYLADSGNHTIRKIVVSTGVVTTIAGTATTSGSADGTGADARFNAPLGLVYNSNAVYVADTSNNTIRKVTTGGVVTTLAGTAEVGTGFLDGTGAAARFAAPWNLTVLGSALYVADGAVNPAIRKIVISSGIVTTVAGKLPGGTNTTGLPLLQSVDIPPVPKLKSATTTVDVTGTTPAAGQVLTATSATAATWQAPTVTITVTPNTGTATPAATDSRTVYTNTGDADGSTITLPAAAAGLEFSAYVDATQLVTLTAVGDDTIRIAGNETAAAGSITSDVKGSFVKLLGISTTQWIATSAVGSWTF